MDSRKNRRGIYDDRRYYRSGNHGLWHCAGFCPDGRLYCKAVRHQRAVCRQRQGENHQVAEKAGFPRKDGAAESGRHPRENHHRNKRNRLGLRPCRGGRPREDGRQEGPVQRAAGHLQAGYALRDQYLVPLHHGNRQRAGQTRLRHAFLQPRPGHEAGRGHRGHQHARQPGGENQIHCQGNRQNAGAGQGSAGICREPHPRPHDQ